jgi:threonine dehydrogenase-like Zn-dependent dehydrogenase
MRAARITGPEQVALEDAPVPDPSARELRFRVLGTGVCASNLGPWFGLPWTKYPLAPGESGHEAWGVVDAVGSDVSGLAVGDCVAAISYAAYAEYDLVREEAAVRLPPGLAESAFPGEPLGCALNIFERARIERGQHVAIVGSGFLGLILGRLAASAGAHVIAISRRPTSLELARTFGASTTIPLEDHGAIVSEVQSLTAGRFCERVIEATGKQWPLDLAAELTGERGRLVIAGYHQDGPRNVNMQLWNWRGLDVINAHERDTQKYVDGVRAAIDAVESKRIDPVPLYTHRYPLEQLGEALAATAERPAGFVKALVLP